MVTRDRDAPFLFLTTSNSCAPTGRNARAQARSQSAKQTNPAKPCYGSFGTFVINATQSEQSQHDGSPSAKRRRIITAGTGHDTVSCNGSSQYNGSQLGPLRILATHFRVGRPALPPNVDFEDVLKVAAFHIRRRSAQMINTEPDRILEALRCRQWCLASASRASLGRSLYLDNAIACVVAKVQHVVSGRTSDESMLWCYTEALHSLRDALQQPTLHDRLDMLSATHLLAIYEMLDFPNSVSWAQHVDGAAALVRMPGAAKSDHAETAMHAAPMFVEALLSNDMGFLEGKLWKTMINSLGAKRADPGPQSLACLTSLRSIFADSRMTMEGSGSLSWAVRMPLLARAHELRFRMRSLILGSEKDLVTNKGNSKGFDILGLFLVSIIMLDRLILTLRQDANHRGFALQEDTQGLCNQMVRFELAASDADPDKEILRALKRQARYPSLTYSA